MADPELVFEACDNCSTFVQQIQYADSLTDVGYGGVLGIGLMIMIGAILFLMMKAFGAERAAPVAFMITSFIGILLGILGILNSNVIYISIILLVVSLFILLRGER